MNQDNNPLDESLDSFIQDAESDWYSDRAVSPDPAFDTTTASSTPSTIEYDMQIEQDISLLSMETMCISSDDDDGDASRNKGQQRQQMANILFQDWLPSATSTSLLATVPAATSTTRRSEREVENELFQHIQNLVREFLRRPNRECPYYRVMRWTIDEQPRLEYILTVVINRPTIIHK